ncbi:MAG: phosphatase PAP2 family protein [Prolixibacteraceae bacterium]|nr:phosphatase PAP2 family protein [Prolixibacteraceae bacterium]
MKLTIKPVSLLILTLTLFSNLVVAQIDTLRLNKYYFKKYWTDTKLIVTSPARWQQRDWAKFGILVSGTAALSLADQTVADFSQSHKTETLDFVSTHFLEHFDVQNNMIVISGFFAYGVLAKDKKSVSTALLTFESFALASLITRIPKNLAGRERPDNWQGYGPYTFKGPFHGVSFPSGHTTASFAVASVIANQYRDHKWVPITAYSVATLAGLSRIYDNKHWLTDVVAGAAIGTLVGNLVSHRKANSQLTVVPYGNSNFQGIKLAYVW